MLTSLRDKKRLRTRAEILTAAAECIDRKGYRNANMRDIAGAAEVAYQTLYNYFPSKARIAMALLERDADTGRRLDEGDGDLVEALSALARSVATRVRDFDRELWLEAVTECIREDEKSVIRCFDPGIGEYLRRLVGAAQQRGHLDAYVDTAAVAAVVESILNSVLLDPTSVGEPNENPAAIVARIELVLRPYLRVAQ